MTTLNIRVSEQLRRFLDSRAAEAGYADPSEYVTALIRKDRRIKADARRALEQKLLDGLDSGPAQKADDAYWDRKQSKLAARQRARKGS